MADTFAFAELRKGAPRKVAFEAVTAARMAADATGGGEVHALTIGGAGAAKAAEQLARFGADVVFVVEHPDLERGSPEVFAATAAERLRAGSYRAGFFAASAQGRDLAPRVAAQLDVPLASDLTGFEMSGDVLLGTHPTHIGTLDSSSTPSRLKTRRHSLRNCSGCPK